MILSTIYKLFDFDQDLEEFCIKHNWHYDVIQNKHGEQKIFVQGWENSAFISDEEFARIKEVLSRQSFVIEYEDSYYKDEVVMTYILTGKNYVYSKFNKLRLNDVLCYTLGKILHLTLKNGKTRRNMTHYPAHYEKYTENDLLAFESKTSVFVLSEIEGVPYATTNEV